MKKLFLSAFIAMTVLSCSQNETGNTQGELVDGLIQVTIKPELITKAGGSTNDTRAVLDPATGGLTWEQGEFADNNANTFIYPYGGLGTEYTLPTYQGTYDNLLLEANKDKAYMLTSTATDSKNVSMTGQLPADIGSYYVYAVVPANQDIIDVTVPDVEGNQEVIVDYTTLINGVYDIDSKDLSSINREIGKNLPLLSKPIKIAVEDGATNGQFTTKAQFYPLYSMINVRFSYAQLLTYHQTLPYTTYGYLRKVADNSGYKISLDTKIKSIKAEIVFEEKAKSFFPNNAVYPLTEAQAYAHETGVTINDAYEEGAPVVHFGEVIVPEYEINWPNYMHYFYYLGDNAAEDGVLNQKGQPISADFISTTFNFNESIRLEEIMSVDQVISTLTLKGNAVNLESDIVVPEEYVNHCLSIPVIAPPTTNIYEFLPFGGIEMEVRLYIEVDNGDGTTTQLTNENGYSQTEKFFESTPTSPAFFLYPGHKYVYYPKFSLVH